jgi:glycosyltransferase involved in cell wall biosynthesis
MKTNSQIPKVSIIIPVYYGSTYLKAAIQSAVRQSYGNTEIIVIDSSYGSDSEIKKILNKFKKNITYYRCKNDEDATTATIVGMKKATGDYISVLYETDRYKPKKLAKQVALIGSIGEEKCIIYSGYEQKNAKDGSTKVIKHSQKSYREKPELLMYRSVLSVPTLLIPTSAVSKLLKVKDVKIESSYALCLAALGAGYKLVYDKSHDVIRSEAAGKIDPEHSDELLDRILFGALTATLSKSDMERLEGSEYNFYVQTRLYAKNKNYPAANEVLSKEFLSRNKAIEAQIRGYKTTISAITPVYNRAKLITEVLESVENQTLDDYCYVIIDDGSHDNTGEIVSRFIKNKPNWFYIYHDNMGEAETVNYGWSITAGDYFVQVNSDDPVKKDLFAKMSEALSGDTESVLAYCDFDIIDENGKTLQEVKSPDYDFIRDLSEFSCYAASPGAFIRKKPLADIKKLKDSRYRHTNDIKMLWNLSLRGKFMHVAESLACWRSHEDGISIDRYHAIPEIEEWLGEYFNQKLPKEVMDVKAACMQSVYKYFIALLENSASHDKGNLIHYYKRKLELASAPYVNLQVGDNDLIGNKFNGHNLHIALRGRGIDSSHLVWNKDSDDEDTYLLAGEKDDRFKMREFIESTQRVYDLDNVENPLIFDVMYNKLFLTADVVHLHLLHNGLWDLNVLPTLSRLKPLVWTIHDMWVVTGDKRAEGRPDYYFPLSGVKNIDLNWEFKRAAIQNADITYVVASKYMQRAVAEYPLFQNKRVVYVPFGLDFSIFYPRDKKTMREELGLGATEYIVLLRGDGGARKGLQYIEHVMQTLGERYKIHFIVVGGNEVSVPPGVKTKIMGWVTDDELMAKLYSASDLFLMPSTRENFGMMAIESMACGTVPVVLDGTALPETVNAPMCGVATPQTPTVYTSTVEQLLLNASERKKRSSKGVRYVKEKHSMEEYLTRLEGVYSEAMSSFNHSDVVARELKKSISQNNQTVPQAYLKNIHFYNKPVRPIPRARYQYARFKSSVNSRGLMPTLQIIRERAYEKVYAKRRRN